jgi:hypothetical protein
MTQIIYAVFTQDWDFYSQPVLKQLFYEKSDADAYAEELRNEMIDLWNDGEVTKVYSLVKVEEAEIK